MQNAWSFVAEMKSEEIYFVFRLGELHVVFEFLKVLGKYISGSGLDQVLVDAGAYGPTTLAQILDGKHMKRGVEAHMVLYLSLSRRYYEDLLKQHPWIHIRLTDALDKLNTEIQSLEGSLKDLYTDYLSKMDDSGLFHCIE